MGDREACESSRADRKASYTLKQHHQLCVVGVGEHVHWHGILGQEWICFFALAVLVGGAKVHKVLHGVAVRFATHIDQFPDSVTPAKAADDVSVCKVERVRKC